LPSADVEYRHFTTLYWKLATKLDCDILWFYESQRSAFAIADKPNIQRGSQRVMLRMPSKSFDFPTPRLFENWMIGIAHLSLFQMPFSF
jgi:hypothetical protein